MPLPHRRDDRLPRRGERHRPVCRVQPGRGVGRRQDGERHADQHGRGRHGWADRATPRIRAPGRMTRSSPSSQSSPSGASTATVIALMPSHRCVSRTSATPGTDCARASTAIPLGVANASAARGGTARQETASHRCRRRVAAPTAASARERQPTSTGSSRTRDPGVAAMLRAAPRSARRARPGARLPAPRRPEPHRLPRVGVAGSDGEQPGVSTTGGRLRERGEVTARGPTERDGGHEGSRGGGHTPDRRRGCRQPATSVRASQRRRAVTSRATTIQGSVARPGGSGAVRAAAARRHTATTWRGPRRLRWRPTRDGAAAP